MRQAVRRRGMRGEAGRTLRPRPWTELASIRMAPAGNRLFQRSPTPASRRCTRLTDRGAAPTEFAATPADIRRRKAAAPADPGQRERCAAFRPRYGLSQPVAQGRRVLAAPRVQVGGL